jgi:hypothetical protein
LKRKHRGYGDTGTDKLARGHELALQELGSGDQKSIARLHFERYLVVLYALISHFSSETKLSCQCRLSVFIARFYQVQLLNVAVPNEGQQLLFFRKRGLFALS